MSLDLFSSNLPQSLMETQNNPIFYNHHPQPSSSLCGFDLNTHNDNRELEQDFINTEIATIQEFSNLPQSLMETQNNPIFYNHHPQPSSSLCGFDLNTHNDNRELEQDFINTEIATIQEFSKEPMFQKTLTPSDVGRLNRLVIPKQHAEVYFPIGGGGDAAHQQKGFLLTFEDESGKLWRFRYSYWNSSQSYVLTKGWSRYVKEKRLDAGDLVLFERHRLDCERMFIGWRRGLAAVSFGDRMATAVTQPVNGGGAQVNGWGTVFHDAQSNYRSHHLTPSISLPCQPDHSLHADVFENVDNYQRGVVITRRLRLFGVNLECPGDAEPPTP